MLRKIADGTPFAFESQQKYDAVGAAVGVWLKERLVSLCGLEPLADVVPATLYARRACARRRRRCCSSCAAGAGRRRRDVGSSLCINDSTQRGAMFDYIFRAIAAGWGVVVADPHGAGGAADAEPGGPRDHLPSVWRGLIAKCAAERVLIVAHSAGGALTCASSRARADIPRARGGRRLTDASFDLPPHPYPRRLRAPRDHVRLGRPSSRRRASRSARLDAVEERMVNVSAGHESHPATTHAATAAVFEFLDGRELPAAPPSPTTSSAWRTSSSTFPPPSSALMERKSFDGSGMVAMT